MPEFAAWNYLQAREKLWPEKALTRNWSPGILPPTRMRKEIDLEISKLSEARRAPKILPNIPPFSSGPKAEITKTAFLNEFCPYREMHAHWIPFALQVARFEAQRHRQRRVNGNDPDLDMRKAIKALRDVDRHDKNILAGVDRPMLASFGIGADPRPPKKSGLKKRKFRLISERDATKREAAEFQNASSEHLAEQAKTAVAMALKAIRENLEEYKRLKREFRVPRSDFDEWRVSFAATLGFAWQRFTGRNPSGAPGSGFIRFVEAAYRSLDPNDVSSWERPCRLAVRRCKDNFRQVGTDPTLLSFTAVIWGQLHDDRVKRNMTAMREFLFRAVRDEELRPRP